MNAQTGSALGECVSGHTSTILSCDFRPCRPFRCVSAGESKIVVLYEGPPFKPKDTISDHKNMINTVRYAPDGSLFACFSLVFLIRSSQLPDCFANGIFRVVHPHIESMDVLCC